MKQSNEKEMKLKIKAGKKTNWKLPRDVFGHFRREYNINVHLKQFEQDLEHSMIYYLNEIGLSVNLDKSKVDKSEAKYMWAELDGYKTSDGEQICVWMHGNMEGDFKSLALGTRSEFDKVVVDEYQKMDHKQ